jgi:hypothetical protein
MIDRRTLQIITPVGFYSRFTEVLQEGDRTHEQAYEVVEAKHVELFGKRHYSNFDSFRNASKHRRFNF